MTHLALRYYQTTFAYHQNERARRIREMKKRFRTRLSRRRAKRVVTLLLTRMQPPSPYASTR